MQEGERRVVPSEMRTGKRAGRCGKGERQIGRAGFSFYQKGQLEMGLGARNNAGKVVPIPTRTHAVDVIEMGEAKGARGWPAITCVREHHRPWSPNG